MRHAGVGSVIGSESGLARYGDLTALVFGRTDQGKSSSDREVETVIKKKDLELLIE